MVMRHFYVPGVMFCNFEVAGGFSALGPQPAVHYLVYMRLHTGPIARVRNKWN